VVPLPMRVDGNMEPGTKPVASATINQQSGVP
jgi:hypothetical protein